MWWTWSIISVTGKETACSSQDSFAYCSLTVKVYNTRSACLPTKINFAQSDYSSNFLTTDIFTCSKSNQHFQAIEFMDWTVLEKFDIFRANLSKAFFTLTCMALWKIFICWQSHHNSYPQFPWSLIGIPGTRPPFWWGHTKKETLAFLESCCQASSTNIDLPYVLQSTLPHRDPQDLAPVRKTSEC